MSDTSKYTQYKNKFQKEKYDRIALQVKKGLKTEIQQFAAEQGKSLNGFINEAIEEKMKKEGS